LLSRPWTITDVFFKTTYRDSSPLPREMQRSRLRGREQRRHIWRWMQTNRVIQMIVINDTIVLCTTTTAWSDSKMSRDAFSGAKVPEVYDDSVATTLKVIMDVLKVKSYFPRKLNFYFGAAGLVLHHNYHCLWNNYNLFSHCL